MFHRLMGNDPTNPAIRDQLTISEYPHFMLRTDFNESEDVPCTSLILILIQRSKVK